MMSSTPRFHVTCVGFNTLPYEEYMSVYEAELRALGGIVTRQNNLILSDAINFVFGSYYLQDVFSHHHPTLDWYGPFVDQLIHNPGNIIFCNLEQVTPGSAIFGSAHLHLLRQAFIFDYSNHNIEAFNRFGFHNTKLVHPLYSPFLDKQQQPELTTDILFTGAITSHRQVIIDQIEAETGRKVSYFHYNLWGDDLHREILKSRIVLNIKGWPENRSFEALRCLFPLCNGKTIISEISAATDIHPIFKDSVILGAASELPALCKQALDNEAATQAATDARIAAFKQTPFKDALQAGLDAFFAHHHGRTSSVPWRVAPPSQLVIGPQMDGLWNHECLHIDLMPNTGVDLIWHPDEAFPFHHNQTTVRFGDISLTPGSIQKIEVNGFLAGTRHLVPAMKALLDLLVAEGELSLMLPFGDAAWDLPYAVRSFNANSLQPFLGLHVKKLGWTDHTFEQIQISYVPTAYGSEVLPQYNGDVTKWAQAPGTVHTLKIRLIKKPLSDDSHPFDLNYLARYAGE